MEDIRSLLMGFDEMCGIHFLSTSSSIIPNRLNSDVVKNVFSNKEGYSMGLTQIHLTLHTASLSMQSFWVVLLFLRKQMLRILKHTFTDQHPPPPLVSLLHPPPQQDVRIISCTYKEVCSCQLVKYIYILSLFILAKFSCNYNQERVLLR